MYASAQQHTSALLTTVCASPLCQLAVGGDVDTTAAMTGAIAGAYHRKAGIVKCVPPPPTKGRFLLCYCSPSCHNTLSRVGGVIGTRNRHKEHQQLIDALHDGVSFEPSKWSGKELIRLAEQAEQAIVRRRRRQWTRPAAFAMGVAFLGLAALTRWS